MAPVTTPTERQEIEEVLKVYATALDARDWRWLESVFAADAFADFASERVGPENDPLAVQRLLGRPEGREEIIRSLKNTADSNIADLWQHHVTNQLVTMVDPSRATVEAMYFCVHLKVGAGGGDIGQWGGRYRNDMVKTPQGWKIQALRATVLWTFGNKEI